MGNHFYFNLMEEVVPHILQSPSTKKKLKMQNIFHLANILDLPAIMPSWQKQENKIYKKLVSALQL